MPITTLKNKLLVASLAGLTLACTEVRDVPFDPNRDPTRAVGGNPLPPPPVLDRCLTNPALPECAPPPPTCRDNPNMPECQRPLPGTNTCAPVNGAYPDNNNKVAFGAADTYNWGEGGGCIHRNIREVWGVSHNQPLMAWNKISESHFNVGTAPAGATHLYNVEYIVKDFITVRWNMVWTHAFQGGSFTTPRRVVINYVRVAGTRYVPYWEGSIILDYLTDNVTSFWMRNQVKAEQQGPADAGQSVADVYGKLRTGQPDYLALDRGRP